MSIRTGVGGVVGLAIVMGVSGAFAAPTTGVPSVQQTQPPPTTIAAESIEKCLSAAPNVKATYDDNALSLSRTSGSASYLGGECSSFIVDFTVTPTAAAKLSVHGEDAWQAGPYVTNITQAACESVHFTSSVWKKEGTGFQKKWSRTQKGVFGPAAPGSTLMKCTITDVGPSVFAFETTRPASGVDVYRVLTKSVRQGAAREVRAQIRNRT